MLLWLARIFARSWAVTLAVGVVVCAAFALVLLTAGVVLCAAFALVLLTVGVVVCGALEAA
jgi:hypothetical protein